MKKVTDIDPEIKKKIIEDREKDYGDYQHNFTILAEMITLILYDNLKKNYTVTLAERSNKQIVTDSLENAKYLMEELNGFSVIPLNLLKPDREYVLEVRAVLAKKTLPFYVHYLIPFGDFWDFSTEWHEVKFKF